MKVLVVEDSQVLGASLVRGLVAEGFVADLVRSGEEAWALLLSSEYDAIVLDVMLPGISGLEVLERLRGSANGLTPVLILSARSQVGDRIRGLETGADDYLAKPFDFGELVARLRTLVRRRHGRPSLKTVIGDLEVDTAARIARFKGANLDLTRSEYSILEALVRRRGQVLAKEWLVEQLHDLDGYASMNVIEVFVSALRKKLRSMGAPELIVTRRGFGYLIPLNVDDSSEGSNVER